jgi:hypothetical protein
VALLLGFGERSLAQTLKQTPKPDARASEARKAGETS